jgi:glutathione synthase/RimK-type ligase-like ATP-grasp enzyme
MEAGLQTPETAYTNDPDLIRRFLREHGGAIVYKPFRGVPWQSEETSWLTYTSLLTEEQLVADHLLRAVPGIYQEVLPKAYELRVTIMGRQIFAAKILSQTTETGRLDWRKAYHEIEMLPHQLPPEVEARCQALMKKLGIVFGCFDFIVTPTGEHFFLEVNEMGQFLFVEHYSGLPLLDAFSEFLLQGRSDFEWSESRVKIRYAEVLEAAKALADRCQAKHLSAPESVARETTK